MDSGLSCTDSLGLAGIAVPSELTTCYKLFSCGRDWNEQSQALIHSVCAMPGGISAVINGVTAIFPPFALDWSLPDVLALGMALRLTLETCQGPQVRSRGSLSYGGGRYPGGFGCSSNSMCCFWKTNQRPLCLPE